LSHNHNYTTGKALSFVLALNLFLFLIEVIIGMVTGSLALIADAIHMLSDVIALSISWIAHRLGKESNSRKAEIIGATINGTMLLVACLFILKEAIQKLHIGSLVLMGWPILIVASIGLAVNIFSYLILVKNTEKDLNIKSAIGHMWADALGSFGAIISAVFIILGFPIADTIIALIVGSLVMYTAIDILWSCSKVIFNEN